MLMNDSKYDFEHVGGESLVVEQDFRIGKPGIGWDSAFILAEYVIREIYKSQRSDVLPPAHLFNTHGKHESHLNCILPQSENDLTFEEDRRHQVVELGCGNGIAGLAIARSVRNRQSSLSSFPFT
jgi:hypothetical protein